MAKIKILFAVTKGNWGGAQKYVYDLATSLPPADFEVSAMFGESGELKKRLDEKQIPVHSISALSRDIKIWSDLKAFGQIYQILRRERPDVLHLNSPKMGLLGALAGRLVGVKKIIYTSHGW